MRRPWIAPFGLALVLALGLPWAATARAQESPGQDVIPHAQDRPPNPPKSPEEAIAAMTVPPGFAVELVAAEPDLVNPVAMTFDERGRIWATESLEYPRREPGPGRDRVKVLEDTDGDGKADRFTVFLEGLNIPSGVAVGHGGVWVANSPDILFIPDADRDAVPDGAPEVVATGFGRDDTHELPNSLTWGPDGWLYGWNGVFNPSRVASNNGRTYEFTCAIWRIHPKTREFQVFCEGTSNPWGIAINDNGELFASACVIDHLWHLVEGAYYIRQGGPYPPFTYPQGSIVDHTHQKAAYCGIHWFDSDAYPEAYRRKLYMGNIHGNCINVDTLKKDGATYRAEASPDFLSANDAWFMPVVQKTGPDGCLYILDWYDRYHCYQDANRDPEGIDRLKGRLYRVRYRETPRRVGFDLAEESDAALIKRLGSANVYDRDIAQRLLTERLATDKAAAATRQALQSLVLDEAAPRPARMHALWVLIGARSLDWRLHAGLLRHADPAFRAWAVRATPSLRYLSDAQVEAVEGLTSDPGPEVRLQVVIAAAKLPLVDPFLPVLDVLSHSVDDPLIPHAVWQNLKPRLGEPDGVERLLELIQRPGPLRSPALGALWPRVVDRIIGSDRIDGTQVARAVVSGISDLPGDIRQQQRVLDTLTRAIRDGRFQGERLKALRESLRDHVRPRLADGSDALQADYIELAGAWGDPEALERLRARLADTRAHPAARTEALEILVARQDAGVLDAAAKTLSDRAAPGELRQRILGALGPLESPRVADVVLDAFDALDGGLQYRAVELLTQRARWSRSLVEAVAAERVPASAVNVNQLRRLQASNDPELTKLVRTLWGTVRTGRNERRELVVGQMRNFLSKTPGDPFEGRKVFTKLCAQCHKLHGEGQDVGPDITGVGRNDFEQLVSNVFDPNLVIGPAYQAVNVATADGRVLTGLLVEDSPERVALKLQGGQVESIARGDVEELRTSDVSLMPEEIENQLTPQEIADLFAYLALDKPPEDPSAKRLPGAPDLGGPRRPR
jgi:putative heme-binding domain-containing protein